MGDKYELAATPKPTVEQHNAAWQGIYDDLIKRLNAACIDGRMVDPFGPVAALSEAQATIARLEAEVARLTDRIADMHNEALERGARE